MKVLFNNSIIEDHIVCAFNDRALQFGDGLFETMKVSGGQVQLLHLHLERLHAGAQALGLELPSYLNEEVLIKNTFDLMEANTLAECANVKLMVWRQHEQQAAYTSADYHVNTLLIIRPPHNKKVAKVSASFSEDVRMHYWKLSPFKTISALPYVIASRERDRRQLQELILLNVHGQVTECTASNIFWVKNETLYTPSISTGCIAGVMRKFLLGYFHDQNIKVIEVEAGKEQLMEADAVFTTNSQGIRIIHAIDDREYQPMTDVSTLLQRTGVEVVN